MCESRWAVRSPGSSSYCSYSPKCLEGDLCELRLYGVLGSCPYNSRVSRRSQWKPEVSLGEALGDEPTIRRCEEMLCSRVLEAEREKARQAERERAGK